jgi:hypothetical protein
LVTNVEQSAASLQTAALAQRSIAPSRGTLWVLKRAALGLVMLLSVSIGAAVLLDATIDPALEQASE